LTRALPASFRVAEQAGGAASAPAFSPGRPPGQASRFRLAAYQPRPGDHAPPDLRAYGTSLGRAIDRTHPVLAVVENEEDASRFYTGSATDYLRQLRTAVATAPG